METADDSTIHSEQTTSELHESDTDIDMIAVRHMGYRNAIGIYFKGKYLYTNIHIDMKGMLVPLSNKLAHLLLFDLLNI